MLRSRPHESRYFWTAYFGLLSSRIRWKWSPKKASFQKRSPKWREKNAGRQLVYLRMDRYGDLINQFTSYTTVLALHMLYKGCCGVFSITWAVSCRQRIDVDGRKRFEYAAFGGRVFLWNAGDWRKRISVFKKYSDRSGRGLIGSRLSRTPVAFARFIFLIFFLSLKTIRNSSGQIRRRYAFVL